MGGTFQEMVQSGDSPDLPVIPEALEDLDINVEPPNKGGSK